MLSVWTGYLIFVNTVGFFVCATDKHAAMKHQRRVSERGLFAIALLGGAFGVWLAMLFFRHKTKKRRFILFIPLIALAYAAFTIFLLLQAV